MKKLVLSVATATLSLGLMAVPTFAASPNTSPSDGSTDGGSAVVRMSNSRVTPFNTVNAGGGTWNYGSYYSPPFGEYCYSQYQHESKVHSATVIIGAQNVGSGRKNPGTLASASATGGLNDTCNTYWNTY